MKGEQQADPGLPDETGAARGLDGIHHVAIQVTDIAEAVDWYRARSVCEIEYQDDTWALLRFANVSLALVVARQHPPHIAMESAVAGQMGKLTRHRDGTVSCYVRDPDGNVVELMEPQS